jgi:Tfp pilus assembly protein PilF
MFDASTQRPGFSRKCDLDMTRLSKLENDIAKGIASTLKRPIESTAAPERPRYSRDPLAYAEFMRGYRLSAAGDTSLTEKASHHLTNAVMRDPAFALAHATLAQVYASRHFEFDPASVWLEKAEFHCSRALELDPDLPEGHVARAFLLWGPSKNFQHLEAIAELTRALMLQKNLPHAYNRLGTIMEHIGLLDRDREMYERRRPFHPHPKDGGIVQVYI